MSVKQDEVGLNKLPIYDGDFENWPKFKAHFDAFICVRYQGDQLEKLRDAINSDKAQLPEEGFTVNDGLLKALLIRSCTEQAEFLISDCETGCEAWNTLKDDAEDRSPARRATITVRYDGIFLTGTKNHKIKEHIQKIDNLARLLKATGAEPSDDAKVNRLLSSLMANEYYQNFVKTLRRQNLTYKSLKKELIDDYYQSTHMFEELQRFLQTQTSSQTQDEDDSHSLSAALNFKST
ncbi:MAG: hypothetical protein AAGM67_13260 [Bacteroidota bacterium]